MNAAEVYLFVKEQCEAGFTLLQETYKLLEIYRCPKSDWFWLPNYVLENKLSKTKTIQVCKAIKGLTDSIRLPCINDLRDISVTGMLSRMKKLRTDRGDVYNGSRGYIADYKNDLVKVVYNYPHQECTYRPEELDYYLELAYTLTIHKAQGIQAKHVVLVLMAGQWNRALIYTGITRCLPGGTLTIIADPGFIDIPAYVKEDWMDTSTEKTVGQLLPAGKCLSKFFWKVGDGLSMKYIRRFQRVSSGRKIIRL